MKEIVFSDDEVKRLNPALGSFGGGIDSAVEKIRNNKLDPFMAMATAEIIIKGHSPEEILAYKLQHDGSSSSSPSSQ
jgi:hypothetical protein